MSSTEPEGIQSTGCSDSRGAVWVRRIAVGLLAVLIVPLVVQAEPRLVAQQEAFAVASGSMSGTFETGDLIFVHEADVFTLAVGDVVAYRSSQGAVVTHRIVAVEGDHAPVFILQGDANAYADDETVHPPQIIGTYSFRIPYYGFLAGVGGPLVLALVYMVGAAIIATESWSLARRWQGIRGPVARETQPIRSHSGRVPAMLVLTLTIVVVALIHLPDPAEATVHDTDTIPLVWTACIPRPGLPLVPDVPVSIPPGGDRCGS